MPLLSIVIPMYNEEAVIEQCFNTLKPILDAVDQDWEIICVDDGSRDDSVKIVRRLADADARIKLLEFSRNFGKEAALTAGLDATTGDAVIPLDADLQDPPELIAQRRLCGQAHHRRMVLQYHVAHFERQHSAQCR
jgi:glycosyltransferase involved in cell wall biosynthesis